MAGIYIHVPFCKQACIYCDFHFSTNTAKQQEVVNALVREVEIQKNYLENRKIETIYFGGGTPSLLSATQLDQILNEVEKHHSISESAEVTLEANPDDLSKAKLEQLRSVGINRLSIGIQSFNDELLQWMNRSHNAQQASTCVKQAQDVGIGNISIDLIFGSPGQTEDHFRSDLEKAIETGVPHISAYSLTVEDRTVLANKIEKGLQVGLNSDQARGQFLQADQVLTEAGFEHYEISNYAKSGFRSKHNSNYWNAVPYLGIGPSAHSFNGKTRQWNVRSNSAYIQALLENTVLAETEETNRLNALNELLMTRLRTKRGLEEKEFLEYGSASEWTTILGAAQTYLESKHLVLEAESLKSTLEGWLISDRMISDLFILD